MKQRLLVVCPECKRSLSLTIKEIEHTEVKEGTLTCRGCSHKYPITNFIPRFVEDDGYTDSFSYEWQSHKQAQLDSVAGMNESAITFWHKTGFVDADLKGKLILDAGCGAGRFMEIARDYGGHVVGVDMSYSVDVAFKNMGLCVGILILCRHT